MFWVTRISSNIAAVFVCPAFAHFAPTPCADTALYFPAKKRYTNTRRKINEEKFDLGRKHNITLSIIRPLLKYPHNYVLDSLFCNFFIF